MSKRNSFMKMVGAGAKHKQGSRHLRRLAEKELSKKEKKERGIKK